MNREQLLNDENFASGNAYVQWSQTESRIALMAAGLDIEFVAMPWADNIGLGLREHETETFAVGGDVLFNTRQDFALANRAAHMRANVPIGAELPLDAKHANFDAIDLDHLAARVRKG
jgi:hypothetical protein